MNGGAFPDTLVEPEWLEARLRAPDVRAVDATWFLPGAARSARAEYEARHIPGAVYFDIDGVAADGTDLPHMLPAAEKFAAAAGALGLSRRASIVVYDAHGGHMAACRVWWMLRAFGHENAGVLNGGLPRWLAEGRPLSRTPPAPAAQEFGPCFAPGPAVRSCAEVRSALETGSAQVIDARPAARFRGDAPEPRPGLRPGHMPGAVNLPFTAFTDPDAHFRFRSAGGLRRAFADAGADPQKPFIATCGSGVTAAVAVFAAHLLGNETAALYDGSWAEWGAPGGPPVETD